MDKKFFRHFFKQLHRVSPWVFLGVAVVSGVICVFALRNNNLTAIQLRDNVNKVDQQNSDVEGALRKLRTYVYNHMNTDLSSGPNAIKPPIQLKYTYDRLEQAEKDRVSAANSQIYTDAQTICQQEFPVGLSGGGRVPCIKAYVTTHGATEQPIPASLYEFDFVSPFWSPDLAGWSLVIAVISLALFVLRYGLERWVKAELRDL
jgi:hypothetical protein